MVFGFFSRKRDSAQIVESGSQSGSPEPPPQEGGPSTQLRTPSPSVDSGKQNSPPREPEPPITPSPPPDPLSEQQTTNLYNLIQSIPPQTLHTYTLDQLRPSHALPSETLAHLISFFAELAPPPRLHCVRCHKLYFEVENNDRSCLVPHDDESAEVERVNSKGKSTLYETLWNCCGRTVEGDGDQGPPDGWCYEGKHTTDTKRARFRADSTPQDDKLTSCHRMRCNGLKRASRKRSRAADDLSDGEEESDAESSPSAALSTSPRSSVGGTKRRRAVKKLRTQIIPEGPIDNPSPATAASPDQMDVDEPTQPPASTSAPVSSTGTPSKPRVKAVAARPPSSRHIKAKSLSTPKTSSPLVLEQIFVSRSVSPETQPNIAIVAERKPKSTVKPKSSAASLRKKATGAERPASPSKLRKSLDDPPDTPSKKESPKPKPRRKTRTKALEEVVDSSVIAERDNPTT